MKTLKIQKTYTAKNAQGKFKAIPQINLAGIYLQEFGFEIGNFVNITLFEGKLIIEKCDTLAN